MKITFSSLLIFVMIAASFAGESKTEQITIAMKALRKALKDGNVYDAVDMKASFPNLPLGKVQKLVEGNIRLLSLAKSRVNIWIYPTSAKVIGDCAVILIGGKALPKPDTRAFLIRQNGKWKVLHNYHTWKRDEFDFTAEQLTSFEKLAEHAATQQRILYTEDNPIIE